MRRAGWAVVLLVASGCSLFVGQPRPALEARRGAVQEGVASWYGPGFHGNPTSSGEIYDQEDMTAAHQTLPLGTSVAVTNLDNGRSIEVRINDRGPFVDGRIIDLSRAAARSLGMIGPGTAPVRVEVLGAESTTLAAAAYAVQVGAFADKSNAERLQAAMRRRFDNVYISPLDNGSGKYYRVRLGRFADREGARDRARQVVALGLPAVIVEDGTR